MKTSAFFLFATKVNEPKQLIFVAYYLRRIVKKGQWNFDLEDSDRVLRLQCDNLTKTAVVQFLKTHHLFSKELHFLENEMPNLRHTPFSPLVSKQNYIQIH
ncbi:hypothetical protein [Seonamhaeicola marinus]|uniref:Uncharacterized protein n=1 Tax=Seonamhaeicola marinus TaxID=1912246 RepID=A0A5D0HI38_9FLAO|nr:hypothetical protein [Seonamhaeicola marinus]TYA69939.1 hypothetical protein FUA24_21855 [Seonamhaeicola marinus]